MAAQHGRVTRRLALLAALLISPRAQAHERWPSWRSEVDQIAAPIFEIELDRSAADRRSLALQRLDQFATPVIEDAVVQALSDPTALVRREALRLCYLRQMPACIAPAARIWGTGIEPTLRVAALRVLALDPDAARLAILLGALRDPSDELRAQAAQILGWARLEPEQRPEVRRALMAKLSDPASAVRRRALESIGLLGPGEGTLALTRLLDDPEPTVRAAAAQALSYSGDERATPALLRALEAPNEGVVRGAIISALVRLPGDDVAQALLLRLDDPPTGLTVTSMAEAIGARPNPEPALIHGLIERLPEPRYRPGCLRALLLLGEPAAPALRDALNSGLQPTLADAVQRLLNALEPPPAPAHPTPIPTDPSAATHDLRMGDAFDRWSAGAALGAVAPGWIDGHIARDVDRYPATVIAPWLIAIGAMPRRPELGDATRWALIAGFAEEPTHDPAIRCAAAVALGHGPTRAPLQRLLGEARAEVRACAVAGLAASGIVPESALLDVDDRVRTVAALSAHPDRMSATAWSRVEVLASLDPSAAVRTAARHAIASSSALSLVARPERPTAGVSERYATARRTNEAVQVPRVRGRVSLLLIPTDAELEPREPLSPRPVNAPPARLLR